MDDNTTMDHLGMVLAILSNLAPGHRCRGFEEALEYYNQRRTVAQIMPTEDYLTLLVNVGPLDWQGGFRWPENRMDPITDFPSDDPEDWGSVSPVPVTSPVVQPMFAFAIGDRVRLKSGGPIMTIMAPPNYPLRGNLPSERLQCRWFDETGCLHDGAFDYRTVTLTGRD